MKDFPLPTRALQCYACIEGRKKLSSVEHLSYETLHKGYTGEKKFAELVHRRLSNDYLALYDILLEEKGTLFQIDCLLLFSNQISLHEIKYFQGEFELKEDSLYDCIQQKAYRNPLHQLKRSNLLLHDLLQKNNDKLTIQSHLIINHDKFT